MAIPRPINVAIVGGSVDAVGKLRVRVIRNFIEWDSANPTADGYAIWKGSNDG